MTDDFKRNVLAAMAHGRRLMEANPGRDPMRDVEAASRGEPFEPWIQPPADPATYCPTCGLQWQVRPCSPGKCATPAAAPQGNG